MNFPRSGDDSTTYNGYHDRGTGGGATEQEGNGRGMSRHVDLLEGIDFRVHAPKLRLYLSQVCELANISKMQLDYWTTKADIPTQGRKQRVYDYDAIILVMMIKQARDQGLSLPAAIDAAKQFIAEGRHLQPEVVGAHSEEPFIQRL